jgi:DNA helicase-2/ATP-dependent DNA helicase PcrA
VPYQLRGAERFFDRPEVKRAIHALRGAARFGGNDSLLDDAPDLPSQVRAVLSGDGWTHQPPAGSGAVRERWESLAALAHLAQDFAAAKPDATLGDLVAELDERAGAQHAPTVQGVTLASLHSAKGLEWDVVFLVGVAEGMMPITYAKTDEQIEEERRLLYVGVTRAREHLSVSWALSRSPGGRPNRRPSRFLDGLRPGSVTTANRGGAVGPLGSGGIERGASGQRPRRHPTGEPHPRPLPGLRPHPQRRRRDETDALRGLPLRHGRGPLRAVARLAGGPGAAQRAAGLLRLHGQDPDGHRRSGAVHSGELSRIPGVRARKLNRYGADVLAICAGQELEERYGRGLIQTRRENSLRMPQQSP